MRTEIIFENIEEKIINEIATAQKSIVIAVDCIASKSILIELLKKSRQDCAVSLITADSGDSFDYSQLTHKNSKVVNLFDLGIEYRFNKFCVIDYCTVITGNYSWGLPVQQNTENIVITYDDPSVAEQFLIEFNNITAHDSSSDYQPDTSFPIEKIIKRLEIIKNYIILEDSEELAKEAQKLRQYGYNPAIDSIVNLIIKSEYSKAIDEIQVFINANQRISKWIDPEIAGLKLEIKKLEHLMNAYSNERIDIDKTLSNYIHRHTIEVGYLILNILRIKKIKFKKKNDAQAYTRVEKDEFDYQQQVNKESSKKFGSLDEDELKELKSMFRQASILCHPDKVSEEHREEAHHTFIDLKTAYENNDINRVRQILNDLEKGNEFVSQSESISEKDILKVTIESLKEKIKSLENEIIYLRAHPTFAIVSKIKDMNEYFRNLKTDLTIELELLQKEVDDI